MCLLCKFYFVADPIGGGFCLPPDRTVCGPPPLEANLFAFGKRSLIYKTYVWVLPIYYFPFTPSPLLPIHYFLFTLPIPHSHLPPPLSPIHPPPSYLANAYCIFHIADCIMRWSLSQLTTILMGSRKTGRVGMRQPLGRVVSRSKAGHSRGIGRAI